jgi:hypothetical protein
MARKLKIAVIEVELIVRPLGSSSNNKPDAQTNVVCFMLIPEKNEEKM